MRSRVPTPLVVLVLLAWAWAAVPASAAIVAKAKFAKKAGFANNSGLLDGIDSANFALDSDVFSLVLASDGPGSGLDADTLDGMTSQDFAEDAEVLPAVLAGDGPGSGLDADTLDGMTSQDFARAGQTSLQAYCATLQEPGNYAPCNDFASTVDDPTNLVGAHSSIAIGTDGNPLISYFDNSAGALKVAKCDDPACAGMDETITTVDDPANAVGLTTSIAIGIDGNPVISYLDQDAGALKVARCNDPACAGTDETITTVDDPANAVGADTSIAIGTDGNPVISYRDGTAGALKVARCNDPACVGTNETITTVDDPPNNVGWYTSIAIGTDGNPVISYYDFTADALKVARCNDPACAGTDETITTVDDPANDVGAYTSMAIGADGNPVISYFDNGADALKVAKCNDPACSGTDEAITTVDDPANGVGPYTSIAIGTDGNAVISYWDGTAGALKVARCNDPACSGMNETITTVDDPPNNVGEYTSIAIGTDGNPVISYWDNTADSLKVARPVL